METNKEDLVMKKLSLKSLDIAEVMTESVSLTMLIICYIGFLISLLGAAGSGNSGILSTATMFIIFGAPLGLGFMIFSYRIWFYTT